MIKPTVFIFHGTNGSPDENWFPWLRQSLEVEGYTVIIPQFPTLENQSLENWLKTMDSYKDQINAKTILVGHSLGATFALTLLEQYSAKATFLLAGFVGKIGHGFDTVTASFAQRQFDWAAIQQHCSHFEIMHADNDPYVALDKAKELGQLLNTEVTVVPGAGHFNKAAGYTTFPLLLETIKESSQPPA